MLVHISKMRQTKRLFLVPEEIFQTFTQQQDDGTPIGMVRNKMRHIENDDMLNTEEKAMRYQQEFKRLNKLARDAEERPMDVRLQNMQEITDLLPPTKETKIPQKVKRATRIKSTVSLGDEEDEWADATSREQTPPKLGPTKKVDVDDDETTPKGRQAKTSSTADEPPSKEAIIDYILKNSLELGINTEGKILKSDGERPYRTSNLDEIVSHLMSRDKKNQFKNFPVGFKEFVERAKGNAFLQKYLFSGQVPHQYGTGSSFTSIKTHKKPKEKMLFKFKPTLWY